MPKIAFHLNTLCHGGAERVVTNLANQFNREGYEVVVATEWIDEDEFVLDPGVRRVNIGPTEEDFKKDRITIYRKRIQYLREFMIKEKPDVLVAFARLALFRALMACKGTGVPVVISVRIDPNKEYTGLRNAFTIKRYIGRASGAVFQTEDARKFFAPKLQDNSTIILNPINEKYIGLPEPLRDEKVIVNVARIQDFKNQLMLIDAFKQIHDKHPDYVLRIYGPDAGDGTWALLEEKIKHYGFENCVFLMGGSDELEKQVPHAKVFAYSSDYEGMPNSLMEAMAMGMPCVSTDCPCGGPRMLIESGVNGYLIPVGDTNALAARVCELIEDPDKAATFGREAAKIKDRANMKAIYEQWKAYLDTIITK